MTQVIPTQMIILDFAGKPHLKIEAEVEGLADKSEKLVEILGRMGYLMLADDQPVFG